MDASQIRQLLIDNLLGNGEDSARQNNQKLAKIAEKEENKVDYYLYNTFRDDDLFDTEIKQDENGYSVIVYATMDVGDENRGEETFGNKQSQKIFQRLTTMGYEPVGYCEDGKLMFNKTIQ